MAAIIDTLETREQNFRKNLKDSNGKVFEITDTVKIGESTIYTLRTKDRSYYYTSSAKKTQICLHFTVGSVAGDIATLTKPGSKVSVHYVVDRLGNIYNLIPLDKGKNWSYHLGANCIGTNSAMSKSAIGIEVSNYGPLDRHIDGYYNAYGQLYCAEERHVENFEFRGHSHYCRMTEAQKTAVCELVDWLCEQCGIPHIYKLEGMFENDVCAREFRGIFTHAQVRKDKFDFPYEQIRFVKDRWQESVAPRSKEPAVPAKEGEVKFTEVRMPVQAHTVQAQPKNEPEKKPWYSVLFSHKSGQEGPVPSGRSYLIGR